MTDLGRKIGIRVVLTSVGGVTTAVTQLLEIEGPTNLTTPVPIQFTTGEQCALEEIGRGLSMLQSSAIEEPKELTQYYLSMGMRLQRRLVELTK